MDAKGKLTEIRLLATELEVASNMVFDDDLEGLKQKYGTMGLKLMCQKIYTLATEVRDTL